MSGGLAEGLGFLVDNAVNENHRTKAERIQVFKEKLKMMNDVLIDFVNRSTF